MDSQNVLKFAEMHVLELLKEHITKTESSFSKLITKCFGISIKRISGRQLIYLIEKIRIKITDKQRMILENMQPFLTQRVQSILKDKIGSHLETKNKNYFSGSTKQKKYEVLTQRSTHPIHNTQSNDLKQKTKIIEKKKSTQFNQKSQIRIKQGKYRSRSVGAKYIEEYKVYSQYKKNNERKSFSSFYKIKDQTNISQSQKKQQIKKKLVFDQIHQIKIENSELCKSKYQLARLSQIRMRKQQRKIIKAEIQQNAEKIIVIQQQRIQQQKLMKTIEEFLQVPYHLKQYCRQPYMAVSFKKELEQLNSYIQSKQYFIDSQHIINQQLVFPLAKLCKTGFSLNKNEDCQEVFSPNDIRQGWLGNCYFLASISALANKCPSIISRIFPFRQNPANFFVVRLFVDGKWQNIKVDHFFPKLGDQFTFSKAHNGKIWVPLIQKAFAKIHYSYYNIQNRPISYAFKALTGAPCKDYIQKDGKKPNFKQFIMDGFDKNAVMVCSGSQYLGSFQKQSQEKFGLVGNHAYSILDFLKVQDIDCEILLLKLRNPWGTLAWKCDWSFQSQKWTDFLRKKYNYSVDPKDGSFYICWQDFIKYFQNVTKCLVEQKYVHSSKQIFVKLDQSKYIQFQIENAGKYIFNIFQDDKEDREQPKNRKIIFKSNSFLVILKKNKKRYKYCGAITQRQNDLKLELQLQKGEYVAKLQVNWQNQNGNQCVFSSYSEHKVHFEQIVPSQHQMDIYNKDTFMGLSQIQTGQKREYDDNSLKRTEQFFFSSNHGLGYIKVKNLSKVGFRLTINLRSYGIKVLRPFKLPFVLQMLPNSPEYQICGFQVDPRGYSYFTTSQCKEI